MKERENNILFISLIIYNNFINISINNYLININLNNILIYL